MRGKRTHNQVGETYYVVGPKPCSGCNGLGYVLESAEHPPFRQLPCSRCQGR